jgi:hypothetical protein
VAVAAVALMALAAVMAVQAGRNGGTVSSSPSSAFSVQGWVSYVVRDANGNIKAMGAEHNTINADPGLDNIWNAIVGNNTATQFKRVSPLSVAVGTDDPVDGVTGTNILTQTTNGVTSNNVDGTAAATTGDGIGTVTALFTGQGTGGSILQIVLHKDSDVSTGNIVEADLLAYQDVPDVTLAAGDTVTYTWTIDFDSTGSATD